MSEQKERLDHILHSLMYEAACKSPFDELVQEALQLLSYEVEELKIDQGNQ